MLDRTKIAALVAENTEALCYRSTQWQSAIRPVLGSLIKDERFAEYARNIAHFKGIPFWDGDFGAKISIGKQGFPYHIAAVDGSQIYPDYHEGFTGLVLNIGTVIFGYDGKQSFFVHDSMPEIFTYQHPLLQGVLTISADVVDALRQEYELRQGLTIAQQKCPILFDGSLIFWPLEAKGKVIKDFFFSRYVCILEQFFREHYLYASYMSLPQHKELMSIVRLYLQYTQDQSDCVSILDKEQITDALLLTLILNCGERTTVFKNNASISSEYPEHSKPYFFYLHTGEEIARIEIPAWIASDRGSIDALSAIILDQCAKGFGYPICLAEAHEQAVIKEPDRDFFYQVLTAAGIQRGFKRNISQKLLHKKRMSI